MKKYQDYVIKDGKLVGEFEDLYSDFADPWNQSELEQMRDSRRVILVNWLSRLEEISPIKNVGELGCGFGHISGHVNELGFKTFGLDISETAIKKAKKLYPKVDFCTGDISEFDLISNRQPDVLIMSEITWYVLDSLEQFLGNLKKYASTKATPTYLIHLLTTYPVGVQKYGLDYFSDLPGILSFFDLDYLETAEFYFHKSEDPLSQGTFFVGRV